MPGEWGPVTPLSEINSTVADDRGPWLSKDGLDLYYVYTGTPHRIRKAHRSAPGDSFSLPAYVTDAFYGARPFVSDDQQRMWVTTSPSGGGGTDLAFADFDGSTWSPPFTITELDTGSYNQTAFLTPDELTMYYASNRAGASLDLYVTTRMSRADPWGPPLALARLNTDGIEQDPTVSTDGQTIWFTRDDNGSVHIFEARRTNPSDPTSFDNAQLFAPTASLTPAFEPFISRDGTLLLYAYFDAMTAQTDLYFVARSCQ